MENILTDLLQQVLETNYVPVHRIAQPYDGNLNWLDLGLRETILCMENAQETSRRWLESFLPHKLYHVTDSFQCNYTILRLPESDELLVCGPILFEEIRAARFSQICEHLHLPSELYNQLQDYYYHVTFVPVQTLYMSFFNIFCNYLFGKDNYEVVYSDFGDLDEWYQNYTSYFRIPDQPLLSIQMIEERYQLENATMSAVASGNEARALECAAKWLSRLMPQRLSNRLRDNKDYAITLNTLLRKTAEQAGVHPIHIDSYSNRNIQLIEQLTSADQYHVLHDKMIRGYCRLIRKHNLKEYSLLTQKVITYVNTDLCADLSLKSLSEHLSVNASYLSTLFKKEMGIPLTDFVNQQRIKHAQKLLLSTDMPIKSVALQSGIPDVYYFSRLFKRITNTTPKVYRETATYSDRQELSDIPRRTSDPASDH